MVGFGIGSILTPLLLLYLDAAAAIAAVAIPHALASALRTWRLRHAIDWQVVRHFGLVSAAGGLAGGLLYSRLGGRALTLTLGALLLATCAAGLTGWAGRWRPRGAAVLAVGALSGLFGGVAGNQGGLRAAALLAFGLTPAAFVATSTITGLLVDAARTPVYVWRSGDLIMDALPAVAVMCGGVVIGTLLGERVLLGLPRERFRPVVSAIIGILGVALLVGAS